MSYENIPEELKQLNQWILWREEIDDTGKPTKIPYRAIDGRRASVNNPIDWCDFAHSVFSIQRHNASGIGLVVTRSDPYTFVDLDNANGDDEIRERQNEIFRTLDSYSEISPSGTGLHIICKAVLPELGRRRGKVEIYDNLRFFTFTGNVYHNAPISERQAQIEAIYATLANPNVSISDASGLEHETYSDELVIEKCNNGETADKFKPLWAGTWNDRYQSQSEGDFALINLISFYSGNAAQTKRLFLQSGLGQRAKSKRSKYVDGMVQRSFDRMPPKLTIKSELNGHHSSHIWFNPADYEPWQPKLRLDHMPSVTIDWSVPTQDAPKPIQAAPSALPLLPYQPATPAPSPVAKTARHAEPVPPMQIPGLVGDLVAHTWNYSVHQVAEAAIASALSTMSLLCGRSYRHGTLGLSLYIMLLARTSTGKDFAYKANTLRFNKMHEYYKHMTPLSKDYKFGELFSEQLEKMVRGEIGSSQGLEQSFSESPNMLFHLDEYVENLRLMSQANPPPHTAQIKNALLRLFNHSGPGSSFKAPVYSKRNSAAPVLKDILSASLSILAAGTPEQFYNELSPQLLTSGFIPRFLILDYPGEITRKNPNPIYDCSPELIQTMVNYQFNAYNIDKNITGKVEDFIDVQGDSDATAYLEELDVWCIDQANIAGRTGTNMDGMWSRAKEYIRKVSSLIAVGVNPHMPTITIEHIEIAKKIVFPAVLKINHKITTGQIGFGDDRCESEIKRMIEDMLLKGFYGLRYMSGIKKELIDANMIQLSLLKNKCLLLAAFKSNQRMGARKAFDEAIKSLCDSRIIKRVITNGIPCIMVDVAFYDGS